MCTAKVPALPGKSTALGTGGARPISRAATAARAAGAPLPALAGVRWHAEGSQGSCGFFSPARPA
ncbi:hypothetical protein ACH4GZ_16280 [Streptomyces hygroscopicus]|uniref:hypothetical protein n=1 Tax=Streptomyces hygroscopicus TaxID=1912 RepID=UPI0037981104